MLRAWISRIPRWYLVLLTSAVTLGSILAVTALAWHLTDRATQSGIRVERRADGTVLIIGTAFPATDASPQHAESR
jgi:hypothetical protein